MNTFIFIFVQLRPGLPISCQFCRTMKMFVNSIFQHISNLVWGFFTNLPQKCKIEMRVQVLLFGVIHLEQEEVWRHPYSKIEMSWVNELSLIFTACGASYHIKGIYWYGTFVQSVLTYGAERKAVKAENLHSLERTEHMVVRWMCGHCGVSLKDRRLGEDFYSLLVI